MSTVTRTIARMREQADFIAAHADFLEAHDHSNIWATSVQADPDQDYRERNKAITYVSFYASFYLDFTVSGPDQRRLMADLVAEFGGRWKKDASYETFQLTQTVSENLRVRISGDREAVCTPRVVGTKEVVKPAVEAREAQPETTELVDQIEWDCGSLLSADDN